MRCSGTAAVAAAANARGMGMIHFPCSTPIGHPNTRLPSNHRANDGTFSLTRAHDPSVLLLTPTRPRPRPLMRNSCILSNIAEKVICD